MFKSHFTPHAPGPGRHFEGYYTRVITPATSLGLVFGSYPQQQPDLKHSPTYCSILVNDDARPGGARLSTLQGRPGRLESASRRGYLGHTVLETLPSSPDFVLADTQRGAVFMQVDGSSVLQEAHVGGGHLRIETCGPLKRWGGDGSPEGALQAIPGVGLHWYVHTTRAPVKYWLQLPDGSTSEGQGVAHMEKNWGASFPREFLWAQGFSTRPPQQGQQLQVQAEFALAGGVLPTFNLDKLPVPLPHAYMLGYRSNKLHWDFAPHKGPSTFDVAMAPGRICITARQPLSKRKLVLTLEAPLPTFSRVQGPSRSGFVDHSVESYSALAVAECWRDGQLIERTVFERTAMELGGEAAAMCQPDEAAASQSSLEEVH